MLTTAPHVVVVGSGIVGASLAFHLARSGARVTVIEAGATGGVATPRSWAWINASWGNPEVYFRLRARAMAEWRRLEREVGGLAVAWSGGLLWDLPPAELEAYAAGHAAWGYGIRRVDRAEAARIEPALAAPPELAVHVADEGAVEPVAATATLLAAAESLGATIVAGTPVRGIALDGGRAVGVDTAVGRIPADEIVVAAGAATAELAATAGFALPMTAPPGLLVLTRPAPKILNGLVMAPALHVRQTADGRLLAGSDFAGTDPGDDPEETAAALFAAIRSMLRTDAPLAFESHTVGYRPTPRDGFPAVGRVPGVAGLTLATMHSGITLAPAAGLFLAAEVLGGPPEPLLEPYRLERFASSVQIRLP